MKKEGKIYTAVRETGSRLCPFDSIEEAKEAIREYEEEDIKNGDYIENYYDVVDEDYFSLL